MPSGDVIFPTAEGQDRGLGQRRLGACDGAGSAEADRRYLGRRCRPVHRSNVALQAIPLGLAALGQSLVILLAGVDLSIGSVMSLVTAIASSLIVADTLGTAMLGAAVALGGGIGVGLLNAVLIRYIQIPALIASLVTYSAFQGIALIVRPRPSGVVSSSFRAAPSSRFSTGAAAACGPVSERPGYPLVLSKRVKWSITTRDRQENQRRV